MTTTQPVFNPYGRAHRRARRQLIREAIGTPCPGAFVDGHHHRSGNCTGLMLDPTLMHADHTVAVIDGGTRADQVCCSFCNTSAGATLGNLRRRQAAKPRRQTRDW